MTTLPVYFDIDGTLTDCPGAHKGKPIPERIIAVRELIESGQEVVIWSGGGTAYAVEFAKQQGLTGATVIGKPGTCIDDDPHIRPRDRMRVLSPEDYFG